MIEPSTVLFSNLSDMIQGLSKISGASMPKVVDFEMGKITPAATESKIVANALDRQWGTHAVSFTPKRKFRGTAPAVGYKKYKYANRYPDQLWDEISKQRLASIEKRIGHMNLSKQSWLKLAQMLGIEIKAVAKVRNTPQNFNSNFNTSRIANETTYSITISNNQPTVKAVGGRGILKKAVAGRAGYFKKNLEKGVMDDMAEFAKAYKGLTVTAPGGQLE